MSILGYIFAVLIPYAKVAEVSLSAGSTELSLFDANQFIPTRCRVLPGPGLDCSHGGFSDVPSSNFPADLTWLELGYNAFTLIKNGTFLKQTSLNYLDLSHNRIVQLQVNAFEGLELLERLNLGFNYLPLSKDTYTASLMRNIPNLQILHIEGNINAYGNASCHHGAFQEMDKLTELYTDIPPNVKFVDCFGNPLRLQTLSSGSTWYGCNVNKLTHSTFEGFGSALRELRLVHCGIEDIERGAFEPLYNLSVLDLTYNEELTLTTALGSLYGLQGRNMSEINLQHVNDETSKLENFLLSSNSTIYLNNICVEYIDISSNYIFLIDDKNPPIFGNPQCLQKLRMRKHSLRTLPGQFMSQIALTNRVVNWIDFSGGFSQDSDRHIINGNQEHAYLWQNKPMPLPHSLIWFNVSRVITWINCGDRSTTITGANRLRNLDASYNSITDCRCIVNGLENLVNLNISGSDCSLISKRYFKNFPNLTTLTFRESRLNLGLESYQMGDIFLWLTRLRYIDLSNNDFLRIHPDIFKPMSNLSTVYLQNNKFQSVPEAVLNVPYLRFLDLSDNVISFLQPEEIDHFDILNSAAKKQKSGFVLDISRNPLSCTCETLHFVDWVLNTDVNLIFGEYLNCTIANGTTMTFHSLRNELKDLKVSCVSRFWITFSFVACSIVVLVVVATAVACRYRWHIRYWFFTRCRNGYEPIEHEHEYDGFVCYNHHDYQWVVHRLRAFLEEGKNQYKLCLHHRDFPAGQPIQQNIVDAINGSRKILLVLTEKFVTCDWGDEIEMAGIKYVRERGDNLMIAILLEDIPVRQMPKVVLNLWHRITFLVWSDSPPEQKIFWERLEKAMKN